MTFSETVLGQGQKLKRNAVLTEVQQLARKGRDIRTFTLKADFSNANKIFYDKYGDVIAPVLYESLDKTQMMHSGQNAWFRFTDSKTTETEAFQKLIKYSTVFLPHEEAEYHTFRAVDNFNKNNDNDDFGTLKIDGEPRESHHGYTRYWKFVSDKKHAVKVNDLVQFGISFRNGIGTNVALGGDLYSYRLACLNGAIAKDKKFSFTAMHKGSIQRMLEELVDGIAKIMEGYKTLLDNYRKFAETKLTQQNLHQILKVSDTPYRYLPDGDMVDVITKKEDKTLENPIVKLRRNDATLWEFFNSITNPLSRAEELDHSIPRGMQKISYNIFSKRTSMLHKAMIQVVAPSRSK